MFRLLLVDGTALAYRAFHAIPELTAPDGKPVHAVFGFVRLLRQLESQWSPSHRAVVFDRGSPAHRIALLPEYKAQRKETPEGLTAQWPTISEYLALARVAVLERDGEEADDLMASAARWAESQGAEVLLATSDKDLGQLVTDRVSIVPLTKSEQRQGILETEQKMGVKPGQIAEFLALTGDAVDNIPGVPGVGPKTASRLLQAFGSLNGIYADLSQVEPERIRALLDEHRAAVLRNLALTRLRTDLELDLQWERFEPARPDWDGLVDYFDRLGFRTFAREARDASQSLF